MTEVVYGKTALGQRLYDFGFSRVTNEWLARKYRMPIREVRALRVRIKRALTPNQRRKYSP